MWISLSDRTETCETWLQLLHIMIVKIYFYRVCSCTVYCLTSHDAQANLFRRLHVFGFNFNIDTTNLHEFNSHFRSRPLMSRGRPVVSIGPSQPFGSSRVSRPLWAACSRLRITLANRFVEPAVVDAMFFKSQCRNLPSLPGSSKARRERRGKHASRHSFRSPSTRERNGTLRGERPAHDCSDARWIRKPTPEYLPAYPTG